MSEYITGKEIGELYTEQDGNGSKTRARIEQARALLAGDLRAPLDASIMPGERDREQLRVSLSQKYTLALKLLNQVLQKKPEPLREQSASGIAAEQHATQIERAAKAGMDRLYPRDAIVDNILNEGEGGAKCVPAMVHWDGLPFMHNARDEPKSGIKSTYALDKDGRSGSDPRYAESGEKFKADRSKSSKYFRDREADYKARHLPVVMESVSRLNGIPVGLRRVGSRYEMDAFVERRSFLASSLLEKGYRWGTSDLLTETDANRGMHHLYLCYGKGSKGVYVSYSVDGLPTTKSHKGATDTEIESGVLNLTDMFNLSEIPIAYDYGWSFPGVTNPDDRGVPFVNPFGGSWLALDTLVTMLLIRAWRASSMFLMYKPDGDLLKTLGKTDKVPMPMLKANRITPVLGEILDMPDMTIPEVGQVIQLLGASLQNDLPSREGLGGGDDVAGYAREKAAEDALGIIEQVQQADLNLYAQTASRWLEIASSIGERHGKVYVFVSESVPQSTTGRTARAKIEIDPALFDGDFEVAAEYPVKIGDNMALAQQLMVAHEKGEIPQRIVLEKGFGFTNPDEIIAENEAEKARNTPLGQAKLMAWAAKIAGDEEEAAVMEALAAQELMKLMPEGPNQAANTLPTGAATAGVPGPELAMPDTAASSLGGVIAGQMQAGAAGQAGRMNGSA